MIHSTASSPTALPLLGTFAKPQVEKHPLLRHDGTVGYVGASFSRPFTISSSKKVALRFLSENPADAIILTESETVRFRYGLKVKGYALLEKQTGTRTATLPAGTYYCAVRNRSDSTSNAFRVELDQLSIRTEQPARSAAAHWAAPAIHSLPL